MAEVLLLKGNLSLETTCRRVSQYHFVGVTQVHLVSIWIVTRHFFYMCTLSFSRSESTKTQILPSKSYNYCIQLFQLTLLDQSIKL